PSIGDMHPALRLTLKALQAELLCLAGSTDAANVAINAACKEYRGGSIEVLAQLELALSKMLEMEQPKLAAVHLERALRILSIAKNANARGQVISDCVGLLSHPSEAANDGLAPLDSQDDTRPSRCVDRVKGMIDFCGNPELMGYEAVEL